MVTTRRKIYKRKRKSIWRCNLKKLRKVRLKCQMSPMEEKIECFLNELGISFEREWVDRTLFNDKTGSPLFMDFYVKDYNSVIEYNGKQHYIQPVKSKLKKQQYRDRVKKNWCKRYGVKYLSIHYMSQNNYKKIILDFFGI